MPRAPCCTSRTHASARNSASVGLHHWSFGARRGAPDDSTFHTVIAKLRDDRSQLTTAVVRAINAPCGYAATIVSASRFARPYTLIGDGAASSRYGPAVPSNT